ncbi:MAG: DUF1702 family protein [Thermoleophilaceae bacterium]
MHLLGISPENAGFDRRGFPLVPGPRQRLEEVGRTFVDGYRAGLEHDAHDDLSAALDRTEPELRGFAYEGAAMAVALRDALAPWRPGRLRGLLAGPGRPHRYMVHVGAGWALARLRRRPAAIRSLDPLLRWLALDGYGFHQGYFHPDRHVRGTTIPRGFSGYAARAFDQGLGRSLWFVEAARPDAIGSAIARFAEPRRPDLWSGTGLAAAYAGGATPQTLRLMAAAAAGHAGHVAQGAAFAAAAREHAGNPAGHTELACRILTGLSARDAAALTDAAARGLPADGAEPAYQVWRRRLRTELADPAAALAAPRRQDR